MTTYYQNLSLPRSRHDCFPEHVVLYKAILGKKTPGRQFKLMEPNVGVSYMLQRVIKHKVVLSMIKITSKETFVWFWYLGHLRVNCIWYCKFCFSWKLKWWWKSCQILKMPLFFCHWCTSFLKKLKELSQNPLNGKRKHVFTKVNTQPNIKVLIPLKLLFR